MPEIDDETRGRMYVPFLRIRDRFPDMDDATFKAEVAEPITVEIQRLFLWAAGFGLPPQEEQDRR